MPMCFFFLPRAKSPKAELHMHIGMQGSRLYFHKWASGPIPPLRLCLMMGKISVVEQLACVIVL